MKTEYQPTRREVYLEMLKSLKSVPKKIEERFTDKILPRIKRTRENIKQKLTKKNLKEFGYGAGALVIMTGFFPYVLPRIPRFIDNRIMNEGNRRKLSEAENIGGNYGFLLGLAALATQGYTYNYLARHNHPEFLAIPLATNLASLGYELIRPAYNRAKARVIQRKSLEDIK